MLPYHTGRNAVGAVGVQVVLVQGTVLVADPVLAEEMVPAAAGVAVPVAAAVDLVEDGVKDAVAVLVLAKAPDLE